LSFHFIKTDEQSVETYSPVQVCHFQNIRNFKQIKEDKSSLNESFYEELTDCITTHEYSVRF
jgi:thermostable 8-oxoguanine DNA glycosylase